MKISIISISFLLLLLFSCLKNKTLAEDVPAEDVPLVNQNEEATMLADILIKAEIPQDLINKINEVSSVSPAFYADLAVCLEENYHLRELVDKQHSLKQDAALPYVPEDIVPLASDSYRLGRSDLFLRKEAAEALNEMAKAAQAEGVTFTASSAYRSYDYQKEVYERNVRQMGREAADRESARPGVSQHQTGLVIDFGPIDDSFAKTPASRWLIDNASRFGWSLSFPDGYETVTGYRWESWHYRYVGKNLAAFIDNYFNGIQQYALCFLFEWEKYLLLQN